MTTPNLSLPTLAEAQSGKFRTINSALYLLDVLMGSVQSRTSSGPPGSPAVGDGYIVDVASGAWSGFSVNDLAVYYEDSTGSAAWLNFSPSQGPQVRVEDEDVFYTYDGSDWVVVGAAVKLVDVATSKSLAVSDAFSFQRVTAAATITVDPASSVAFPLMSPVVVFRDTSDAVSVVAGSGVTFLGSATLASQNDTLELMQLETDTWVVRS